MKINIDYSFIERVYHYSRPIKYEIDPGVHAGLLINHAGRNPSPLLLTLDSKWGL